MITFDDLVLFDRLDWHQNNREVHEHMRKVFLVLVKWLGKHNMLNADGVAIAKEPIPDDFSLSDRILTPQGTAFLKAHYEDWLFSDAMSVPIETTALDAALKDK